MNMQRRRFLGSSLGPGISERFSSRGDAFGDCDNDGDIDALLLNTKDPPSLLRNDGGNQQNWIKIKLIGNKVQSHHYRSSRARGDWQACTDGRVAQRL